MDRDPEALKVAKAWKPSFPLHVVDGPFSTMGKALQERGLEAVDVIFLDLGVSSPQLDDADRGFSFLRPGPLDMRMDPRSGPSAADLIRSLGEKELADLIYRYGEEHQSRKISRAIVAHRDLSPIVDTHQLARLVESVVPRRGKNHPATQTFQALRIAVNRELEELESGLDQILTLLRPGGRALIISFHSLEDRLVKLRFREWKQRGEGSLPVKFLGADASEMRENPRSRSAKLRVFEKRAS
jgi:16S rRNA (cytosine1402-N4)-methyltransferase